MPSPSVPTATPTDGDALFAEVYARLKAMAHRELGRGGAATVDTTELVHELYLKLGNDPQRRFAEPAQFFCYAARAMRHILVDRARHRLRFKSGGDQRRLSLTDPAVDAAVLEPTLALALDQALDTLAREQPRAAQVVELHWFAGLGLEQVAQLLGVVRRTVDRDWRYARAFLLAQLD
jgi:RNA polymerase sigma factor (TIGR02999 family)